MQREFDRNMFIMLLSIMIGAIIITYFVADIVKRSQIEEIEEEHTQQIIDIEKKNVNFTGRFLDSLVSLNLAKDFRMDGEINYNIGYSFYKTILSETNEVRFNKYKNSTLENFTGAMSNFWYSYLNFNSSIGNFAESKEYTTYDVYLGLGDLYINLSKAGARLALLRYNASIYLKNLSDLLIFDNGTVGYKENISELMNNFNETLADYLTEEDTYSGLIDEIDLYELYKPLR